jgi:antiviral helicase SKI2
MMKFRGSNDPMLPEMVAHVKSEMLLQRRLKSLVDRTGEAGLSQMPEFLQRVKVLQSMGYVRSDKTVAMKGRVACEINSGSELVGTEIIFGGLLSDLSPQEAVALLSALVFQDKTECNFLEDIPAKLVMAYEHANAVAWNAGQEQEKFGLNIAADEFVKETLNFGLMSVVYHWASGMPFSDLCSLTDVMEGSIVRCIVRLDETCREFRDAARVMGDMKLYKQMQEASDSIKRDIVFAASLYIV